MLSEKIEGSMIYLTKAVFILLTSIAITNPAMASLFTIDFDSLEINDATSHSQGDSYSEDGFTLQKATNDNSDFISFGQSMTISGVPTYKGSAGLANENPSGITELFRTDNGIFDLLSINLAFIFHTTQTDVTFTGELAAGGSNVSQTFTLGGSGFDNSAFNTFNFSSSFTGLSKVFWAQTDSSHQFDNILVNAVPLPAALWLMASGLSGLIFFRRKQKV